MGLPESMLAKGNDTATRVSATADKNETGWSSNSRLDPAGLPLVPTPTNDKYDPLNWSLSRKYICIGIVIYSYFMLTYFTTAPIPSFSFLQEQLNISYSQVSWTFAVPCLGLALGPLLAGALADTYGRRPVLIVSTALAVVASGCTAIKTIGFGGYMAARFFQGLGAGPSANVGLVIINDVSWEHERGKRVGMWAIAANCGTVMGGISKWTQYHRLLCCGILTSVQLVDSWRPQESGSHTMLQFFSHFFSLHNASSCPKRYTLELQLYLPRMDNYHLLVT